MNTVFKILVICAVGLLFSCAGNTVKVDARECATMVGFPDGSTAYLNKNSVIKYVENFKSREVYQEGEVFYVVKKGEVPFVVTTETGEIRVLGTEFKVKSDPHNLEVDVEKGSVELRVNKLVQKIEKGQKALFNDLEETFKISKADFNHKKWVRKLDRELKKLEREINKGAKELEKEVKKIGDKLNLEFK